MCSPAVKPSQWGCFDRSSLDKIVKKYNGQNRDKIICNYHTSDKDLWNMINKRISKKSCNGEVCWLSHEIMDDELLNYYKPLKPIGKHKWLKTTDINKVLNQYEDKFIDFTFMGAVPIDFDLVIREIAFINCCSLIKQGKTRVGFVFNLDKHNQSGSHWVSMFTDFYTKDICYFDSYGDGVPKEIDKLMDKIIKQIQMCTGILLKKKINKVRHQHGSSECGVYSLYFIYNRLIGKSFEDITNNVILDEDVNKWRDIFFRSS